MTNPPQDPCRLMAKQGWDGMFQDKVGDNAIDTIERAIRNHTVVPEMVKFLSDIPVGFRLRVEAQELLAKAYGKE